MADSLNAIIADTPHSLLQLAVAAPNIFATATYGKRQLTNVYLMGTTDLYAAITPVNCREGRFIDEVESRGGRNVCVIGTDVAQGLFLGETTRSGRKFVLPSKNTRWSECSRNKVLFLGFSVSIRRS